MFKSPEFTASLGSKFKDPMHYAISAVRLAYGDRRILNTTPILSWLNRMGEGIYNHQTPDGYSMAAAAWDGPGQMETRFEMARQVGSGRRKLLQARRADAPIASSAPKRAGKRAGLSDPAHRPRFRRPASHPRAGHPDGADPGQLAPGLEQPLPLLPRIHAPLNDAAGSIAMNRRDVLALAAGLTPLIVAGRAFAAPQVRTETQARLLVVFLRGAYDSANLLVPVSSDFYYSSRPTIALSRPDPDNPNAAVPLTADWGLHPALAPSILPLWRKGQVAFVPFAGTDDMTRSHFETQDTIELGQPIQGSRNYGFRLHEPPRRQCSPASSRSPSPTSCP